MPLLSKFIKKHAFPVNQFVQAKPPPVNPIKEREYVQSDEKTIEQFKNYLESRGINVTVRREMGRDIGGACGQLRKSFMEEGRDTAWRHMH